MLPKSDGDTQVPRSLNPQVDLPVRLRVQIQDKAARVGFKFSRIVVTAETLADYRMAVGIKYENVRATAGNSLYMRGWADFQDPTVLERQRIPVDLESNPVGRPGRSKMQIVTAITYEINIEVGRCIILDKGRQSVFERVRDRKLGYRRDKGNALSLVCFFRIQ